MIPNPVNDEWMQSTGRNDGRACRSVDWRYERRTCFIYRYPPLFFSGTGLSTVISHNVFVYLLTFVAITKGLRHGAHI